MRDTSSWAASTSLSYRQRLCTEVQCGHHFKQWKGHWKVDPFLNTSSFSHFRNTPAGFFTWQSCIIPILDTLHAEECFWESCASLLAAGATTYCYVLGLPLCLLLRSADGVVEWTECKEENYPKRILWNLGRYEMKTEWPLLIDLSYCQKSKCFVGNEIQALINKQTKNKIGNY